MTFDDGILTVYKMVNIAEAGTKPVYGLEFKEQFYFGFDVLGYNRYYVALHTNSTIEAVVDIPEWGDVEAVDIVVLESGRQYKISMVQRLIDDDGLRFTKLSLERLGEEYAINTVTN